MRTNEMMDIVEKLREVGKDYDFHENALMYEAADEIDKLREELDTERIRLAACGVIALANTEESAKDARQMKDCYWSASARDVANAVDREMELRKQLQAVEGQEPVAWLAVESADVNGLWETRTSVNQNGDGIPLYTNKVLK